MDSRVRASIYRLAIVLVSLLLDAALGLASAQTKLDAAYTATLWGLPVGHISWTVELNDNRFKAAARGAITGLLRIVADGRGDVSVHGAMSEGKPVPSVFSLNLIAGKWSDDVRIVFSGGKAQEHVAAAAVKTNPDQVPLTDANRVGVVDPMTALLVHIPGAGAIAVPQACDRSVAVFDGHARYNLRLAFKRLDDVKTDEGYQGRAVVCSLKFVPVAGHDPKRYLVTYLAAQHDIEVWLAPLAGSRLLVPYRVTMPTPIGMGVLQATSVCVSSAKANAVTLASRRTDRVGAQCGELCAEAAIRKAAALAVRNATPLSGTAYKLRLLEQQIVDVVQALAKAG